VTPAERLARLFGPDLVETLQDYVDERVEEALDMREQERRWFTVKETAMYLGSTPGAVEKQVSRGTIPSVLHNGRRMVDRRRLDAQIEQSR
jgi:hypothetical protein